MEIWPIIQERKVSKINAMEIASILLTFLSSIIGQISVVAFLFILMYLPTRLEIYNR